MRKFELIRHSLLSLSLAALWATPAFAQDDAADPAQPQATVPAPPPGAVLVKVQDAPADGEYKHFSIVANPLALSIGRYSIQGEWLPALHHALTLNPFYTHASAGTLTVNGDTEDLGTFSGGGAEFGYRFYTGSKGPNGFFVGPSFLIADYSQSGGGEPSVSFTSVGAAFDIGGQGVVGPGIVIGGGFGLQATKNSKDFGSTSDLNFASAVIAGGGIRPRFLFHIGYAF